MSYRIGTRTFDNLEDACDYGKACDFLFVSFIDESGTVVRTYEIKGK
jgi:hypothetical protein